MAVRKINIWPDPVLATKARAVETVDGEIQQLVVDMFETMHKANGIGLAANQVGVPVRVLVCDLDPRGNAKDDPEVQAELDAWGYKGAMAFINPEIIEADGTIEWEEGCLSVPSITDLVKRKERVVVRALDASGQPFTLEAHGLYAVCLQHEIDHLNGKVFVEYLSRLKREVIKRKMERLKTEHTDDGVVAAAG